MSRSNATRETWHPQTKHDRDAILVELHEVLASPHFCNSKRYPALLQYIVENTLAGKSDLLKERTLGVEVFDRPPAYDTNTDTVVRYTAGEVRKRLSLYYHELDRKPSIRISLPAGSYVPEFLHGHEEGEDSADGHHPAKTEIAQLPGTGFPRVQEPEWGSLARHVVGAPGTFRGELEAVPAFAQSRTSRRGRFALVAAVILAVLAGVGWKYRSAHRETALDQLWTPVLRDQHVVMLCTGGSVFSQSNFSGVATAGKDIDYPFVSMQTASAIAQLSALLERGGATSQLQPAATTPLTELRQHPVIFLGGYNNPWSLRLLQPLRFHFSPEITASIVDGAQPGVLWARDRALPYSSADDYALVARFRDTTTDSWVVVLAGLGRNGTEAAAEFATSPHYMQQLSDRIGGDYSKRNVEAVLKVSVVDGKTGAPSILAVHAW